MLQGLRNFHITMISLKLISHLGTLVGSNPSVSLIGYFILPAILLKYQIHPGIKALTGLLLVRHGLVGSFLRMTFAQALYISIT